MNCFCIQCKFEVLFLNSRVLGNLEMLIIVKHGPLLDTCISHFRSDLHVGQAVQSKIWLTSLKRKPAEVIERINT